jgi:hypothetical protein
MTVVFYLQDSNNYKLRYRDLMLSFEQILQCKIEAEDTSNIIEEFPSTMVINVLRGFLDEFNIKQREQAEKMERRIIPDRKRKDEKEKRKREKEKEKEKREKERERLEVCRCCNCRFVKK